MLVLDCDNGMDGWIAAESMATVWIEPDQLVDAGDNAIVPDAPRVIDNDVSQRTARG
jgi:hypothetical protein